MRVQPSDGALDSLRLFLFRLQFDLRVNGSVFVWCALCERVSIMFLTL